MQFNSNLNLVNVNFIEKIIKKNFKKIIMKFQMELFIILALSSIICNASLPLRFI